MLGGRMLARLSGSSRASAGGTVERYTRVFGFTSAIFGLMRKTSVLLRPLWVNLAIATPLSLALAVAYGSSHQRAVQYVVLTVGVIALYFTDYFCNALTCSLIYDQ